MNLDILLVLVILVVTVLLLITERLRVDLISILVLVALVLLGLLSPTDALGGFSNPATITVGAMFILSAALQRTGAINTLGRRLIELAGPRESRLRLSVMAVSATMSAFINNTAAVAVLMPLTIGLGRETRINPSRLLMPLSFAAMFGGVTTLIGTSTNILVSAIAVEQGLRPFSMFEFTPLGLIFIVVGMGYMMTIGAGLLPERTAQAALTERYELNEYLTEVRIGPDSPLVGKSIDRARLGLDLDLTVLDIIRGDRNIPVPAATRELQEGDILIVSSRAAPLVQLVEDTGLELLSAGALTDLPLGGSGYLLVEVVIPPGSTLDGRTLRASEFRRRYGMVVIGLRHHEQLYRRALASRTLRAGDVLLVYGERSFIDLLQEEQRDLLLLQELPVRRLRDGKALAALAIIGGVIALAALEIVPIVIAAVIGCVAVVLAGILTLDEAYAALDAQVLIMLAGILSLGTAMERTGTAAYLAQEVVGAVGPLGPVALVSVFYLLTTLLTETMSNNATAALLAPVVISVAATLGVSPQPFLVAVAFAASASFMTPIGYQTNTMIYGPGGYRFADFTRIGTPLNLLFWLTATLLIPVFWPF